MLTLANGFAAKGLTVDLVLVQAAGAYLADVSAGVRVVDLGGKRVFASLLRLAGYLRRERPHALLSALNHANVVAIWSSLLARTGTRIVVSERATLSLIQKAASSPRQRVLPWLMRWSYPAADQVVAVSRGVADDLAAAIGLARERIAVLYNPVVTPALLARSREQPQHRWLCTRDGPPVVLAVGRLGPEKDFATLIRAFAVLRAQREARLIILGEGVLREALTGLVRELGLQDDVDLPGFAANPFAFMRNASLFVLSSRTEGLPGVLIEAMACGAPVVSTDCPSGPSEILENGKWGTLVPVGDIETLAGAMARVLNQADVPDVERRAGDFDVESAVAGYLRVLGVEGLG
jgi:glycosyltransferase involved in cell wall biosynthesis